MAQLGFPLPLTTLLRPSLAVPAEYRDRLVSRGFASLPLSSG
jgi:hypothetical protein